MAAAAVALAHPLGPYTVEQWLDMDPRTDGSTVELISAGCSYSSGLFSC